MFIVTMNYLKQEQIKISGILTFLHDLKTFQECSTFLKCNPPLTFLNCNAFITFLDCNVVCSRNVTKTLHFWKLQHYIPRTSLDTFQECNVFVTFLKCTHVMMFLTQILLRINCIHTLIMLALLLMFNFWHMNQCSYKCSTL